MVKKYSSNNINEILNIGNIIREKKSGKVCKKEHCDFRSREW